MVPPGGGVFPTQLMIYLRLEHFRRNTLKRVPQLINHWTIATVENNVVPISDFFLFEARIC